MSSAGTLSNSCPSPRSSPAARIHRGAHAVTFFAWWTVPTRFISTQDDRTVPRLPFPPSPFTRPLLRWCSIKEYIPTATYPQSMSAFSLSYSSLCPLVRGFVHSSPLHKILAMNLLERHTAVHLGQAVWYLMWWLIATTVFCGILEIMGWAARLWSSSNPSNPDPFEMQ